MSVGVNPSSNTCKSLKDVNVLEISREELQKMVNRDRQDSLGRKLRQVESEISHRDVMIASLNAQLKQYEEQYKKNIDDNQEIRIQHAQLAHDYALLKRFLIKSTKDNKNEENKKVLVNASGESRNTGKNISMQCPAVACSKSSQICNMSFCSFTNAATYTVADIETQVDIDEEFECNANNCSKNSSPILSEKELVHVLPEETSEINKPPSEDNISENSSSPSKVESEASTASNAESVKEEQSSTSTNAESLKDKESTASNKVSIKEKESENISKNVKADCVCGLDKEFEDAKKEIEQLKEELNEKSNAIRANDAKMCSQQGQINELSQKVEELSKINNERKEMANIGMDEKDAEIRKCICKIENLTTKAALQTMDCAKLKRENDCLMSKISMIKMSLQQYKDQIMQQEHEKEQIAVKYEEQLRNNQKFQCMLRNQEEDHSNDIKQIKCKFAGMCEKCDKLSKIIDDQEKQIKTLQDSNKDLEMDKNSSTQHVRSLQNKVKDLEEDQDRVDKYKQKLETQACKCEKLSEELRALKEQNCVFKTTHQRKMEENAKEKAELNAEICKLQSDLAKLRSEHQKYRNTITSLEDQNQQVQSNFQEANKQRESDMQRTLASYVLSKEKMETEIEILKSKIRELTAENGELKNDTERIQELTEEVYRLQNQLSELQEKLKEKEIEIQNLKNSNDELQTELEILKEKCDEHAQQLEEATDVIRKTKRSSQQKENELDEMKSKFDELSKLYELCNNSCMNEINRLKNKTENLENENMYLKDSVASKNDTAIISQSVQKLLQEIQSENKALKENQQNLINSLQEKVSTSKSRRSLEAYTVSKELLNSVVDQAEEQFSKLNMDNLEKQSIKKTISTDDVKVEITITQGKDSSTSNNTGDESSEEKASKISSKSDTSVAITEKLNELLAVSNDVPSYKETKESNTTRPEQISKSSLTDSMKDFISKNMKSDRPSASNVSKKEETIKSESPSFSKISTIDDNTKSIKVDDTLMYVPNAPKQEVDIYADITFDDDNIDGQYEMECYCEDDSLNNFDGVINKQELERIDEDIDEESTAGELTETDKVSPPQSTLEETGKEESEESDGQNIKEEICQAIKKLSNNEVNIDDLKNQRSYLMDKINNIDERLTNLCIKDLNRTKKYCSKPCPNIPVPIKKVELSPTASKCSSMDEKKLKCKDYCKRPCNANKNNVATEKAKPPPMEVKTQKVYKSKLPKVKNKPLETQSSQSKPVERRPIKVSSKDSKCSIHSDSKLVCKPKRSVRSKSSAEKTNNNSSSSGSSSSVKSVNSCKKKRSSALITIPSKLILPDAKHIKSRCKCHPSEIPNSLDQKLRELNQMECEVGKVRKQLSQCGCSAKKCTEESVLSRLREIQQIRSRILICGANVAAKSSRKKINKFY